jgi:ribonuclease J
VAITGRSMENAIKVSTELGYMVLPENTMVDINHIKSLPKEKVCIVTTGSQGEAMSALFRMAFSTHGRWISCRATGSLFPHPPSRATRIRWAT